MEAILWGFVPDGMICPGEGTAKVLGTLPVMNSKLMTVVQERIELTCSRQYALKMKFGTAYNLRGKFCSDHNGVPVIHLSRLFAG